MPASARPAWVAIAALLTFALAQPVEGQAQTGPTVHIVAPQDGAVLNTSAIKIVAGASGFRLVSYHSEPPVRPGEGHIHFIVDGRIVESDRPSVTVTNLGPGAHRVGAELVRSDHTSLDPPVRAEVSITVPPSAPRLRLAAPAPGASVSGPLHVAAEVANFAIVDFSRQPPPKPGEGHVHFFLDDTYKAVASLTATFDSVPPGPHRVRAELHASDHSPLFPPVFDEAWINVPALRVVTPARGASIPADEVVVRASLENFALVDPAKNATAKPGEGHLHVVLDGKLHEVGTATLELPELPVGKHSLQVLLVGNDHKPVPDVAQPRVSFTTTPVPPGIRILSPVDGESLVATSVAVATKTKGVKLVDPGEGGAAKEGEGHVHYHLGATLVESASPRHVFEGVPPGAHQVRAVLVGNDHKPIAPEATARVTVAAPPSISIVSPAPGAKLDGPNVAVTVRVHGIDLVDPEGAQPKAGQGHLHYYLGAREAIDFRTTHAFDRVAPGPYTVRVALVSTDHTPLGPEATLAILVAEPGAGASPGGASGPDPGTGPAAVPTAASSSEGDPGEVRTGWGRVPAPGLVPALGALAVVLLLRRSRPPGGSPDAAASTRSPRDT